MSGKIVLTYFNARARGELPRLTLVAAGKDFEDKRIEFKDWPAMKDKTPTKALPVLQVGDVEAGQSYAIARYLAREYKLYGDSNVDMLYVDQIVDTCIDLQLEMIAAHFEKDEALKATLAKKLNEETLPSKMSILTDLMGKHGKDGYFVKNKLSLADLAVYSIFENKVKADPKLFEKHPALAEHRKKIESLPKIKDYLAKRPETSI